VVRYARLEAEVKQLRDQLAAQGAQQGQLVARERYAKRRADFVQLEPYFDLNVDEEMAYARDLPEEQYTGHLSRIQTRYARKPYARAFVPLVDGPVEGGAQPGTTKDQQEKAIRIATRSKGTLSYDDALAKVKNGTS
jgi:hypothetical protein